MRPIGKDITKHYQIACSSDELHAICILQAHVYYVLIIPFFTAFLRHACNTTKKSVKLDKTIQNLTNPYKNVGDVQDGKVAI